MRKLFSLHEETLQDFFDETDIDSCFFHKTFDISQSQHRLARVSKGSNRKPFAIKFFHFCHSKTQQRHDFQEIVEIAQPASLVKPFSNFLDAIDQAGIR